MGTAKVAIAQLNMCVGDLAGNAARLLQAARTAHVQGADVLVGPELALTGYPPEDLLLRPRFVAQAAEALAALQRDLAGLSGLHVVVGHVLERGGRLYNAASVLCEGRVLGTYCKLELPNYSVFDEQRYFVPDGTPFSFEVKGVRFALNICEDAWFDRAPSLVAGQRAHVLLVPNASPFNLGKQAQRESVMARCVRTAGCAVVYANLVGGQDELVFDGASFAMDPQGRMSVRLPDFAEAVQVFDVSSDGVVASPGAQPAAAEIQPQEDQVWQALVMGVRDYLGKNGFPGAIIGLSGGIDSALVLAIAVEALGADKVHAVMMPSPYTAAMSLEDARAMAEGLGVRYDEIPIEPMMQAFGQALAAQFAGLPQDATEENIQARIRGTLLMALSNKSGKLVLTTGNKSELSTGYCTLYGDMAGGYAAIKDVPKTLVYRLARWRNARSPVIPERIITRPASAELRPNQTDQDSLPPYDLLDAIMERYMEGNQSAADIVAAGYPADAVEQVVRLLRINEYKRRQAPPGPRVTPRAFGRDWRYPVTNGFRDTLRAK
jgi:NAD+ synthetase